MEEEKTQNPLKDIYHRFENLELFPQWKKCKICQQFLTNFYYGDNSKWFYCENCEEATIWNYNTTLEKIGIPYTTLEHLLHLFVQKKTCQQAFSDLHSHPIQENISLKTVSRYFKIFSKISLQYYNEQHEDEVLEGEVEIDESQLYKMKKSYANGRSYVYSDVWLIGFRERKSKRFLIFPTDDRSANFFIPLLLKHVKQGTTVYTDSFSVYVNNFRFLPESKLQRHGYIHKFVNHKLTFVNELFPDIHTNTVEALWKDIKDHTKKHKAKKLYSFNWSLFFS